jgi:hypothetical protein
VLPLGNMQITHRVTFNKQSQVDHELNYLGIRFKKIELPGGHYTIHFEINEADKNWPIISKIIQEKTPNASSFAVTTYTNSEILEAKYCLAIPSYETGYPYPQNNWLDQKASFYENFCSKCGTYTKQVKPYSFEKEPNLRNHNFMTLFWGNMSIFASAAVFEIFSQNKFTGYQKTPVFLRDTDHESTTVSQIQITNTTDTGLIPNADVASYKCPVCAIIKYNYPKRGSIMYDPKCLKDVDFQQTSEWFGDGLIAYHLPIFSQKVAEVVLENKWSGLQFKPVLLQDVSL